MPHFISVLISQENDPNEWVYAQEASSLSSLETNPTYNSISRMPKKLFSGSRANNNIRVIRDNSGFGAIQIVSYAGSLNQANILSVVSKTLSKQLVKKLVEPTSKKNKKTKKP